MLLIPTETSAEYELELGQNQLLIATQQSFGCRDRREGSRRNGRREKQKEDTDGGVHFCKQLTRTTPEGSSDFYTLKDVSPESGSTLCGHNSRESFAINRTRFN